MEGTMSKERPSPRPTRCPACSGAGFVKRPEVGEGAAQELHCERCEGSGQLWPQPPPAVDG
jgi:DnaJ-class molecular chaperone